MHARMLLGRACCAPRGTRRRQVQTQTRAATPPRPPQAVSSCDDLLPFTQRGVALALGKFDALHRGHRALALAAAELGDAPGLLSFDGMAAVLGWEPRLPVVAPCDRPRVLATWSTLARRGSQPLFERTVPFAAIRSLSPAEFVALLHRLGVSTVVAGSNYKFGYRASGDATALATLCAHHGLACRIVDLVAEHAGGAVGRTDVSSTAVRAALADGDMRRAGALLGRPHRLVLTCAAQARPGAATAGKQAAVAVDGLFTGQPSNQSPRPGLYHGAAWVWALPGHSDGDGEAARAVCGDALASVEVRPDGTVLCALLQEQHGLAASQALRDGQAGTRLRIGVDLSDGATR